MGRLRLRDKRKVGAEQGFIPKHLEATDLRRSYDGKILHRYECVCGNKFLSTPWQVNNGYVASCGCFGRLALAKARASRVSEDPTLSSFNTIYGRYKRGATTRGLSFLISKEEFRLITQQRCHYCNKLPATSFLNPSARSPYVYNGVDRKDNAIGYTVGNCLPCCSVCNYLKGDKGYDEFLAHVAAIAANFSA